jgi:ABC-type multidrug transport system fused ATPase/permease subunit
LYFYFQEVAFFDQSKTGELVNRMSADTSVLQDASTANISMVVRFIFQLIFGIGLLFYSSVKLTLIMLAIVPAVVLGAVIFGRVIRSYSKAYQEYLADATTVAQEAFTNGGTIIIVVI